MKHENKQFRRKKDNKPKKEGSSNPRKSLGSTFQMLRGNNKAGGINQVIQDYDSWNQVQNEIDEQINSIENMKNNLSSEDFLEMLHHLISENEKVMQEMKAKTSAKKLDQDGNQASHQRSHSQESPLS